MAAMGKRPDSQGKVRDIYDCGDSLLMVKKFENILPNHVISLDPADYPAEFAEYKDYLLGRSMLVKKATTVPIECIVRGYLTGSGKKTYDENGTVCGIKLP